MKSGSSLKFTLARYLILLGVLPVLVFGGISQYLLSQSLSSEVTDKNFALATSIAGEIELFLNEPLSLIEQVRDIITGPELIIPGKTQEYLDKVVAHYQFFEMIQLLDESGKTVIVAPFDNAYLDIDLSRQSFFATTRATAEPTWSATFISMRSGAPTLTLSIQAGQGMLVGYLNLHTLSKIVKKLSNQHKYAFITDLEGTVIAHFDPSYVQLRNNLSNLKPVREGLAGRNGTFKISHTAEEFISSVVTVPVTGWPVVYLQHYDDAFAAVNKTRQLLLIAVLLTIILSVAAALLSVRKTSTPIERLVAITQRIANGDYSHTETVESFSELQELDRSFQKMVTAILDREQRLIDSERLHRELVESIPYGVQEITPDGLITYTNGSYNRIFECTADVPLGQPIWATATTAADKQQLQEYLQYLVTEQPDPTPYEGKARTYKNNVIDLQVVWQYKRDTRGTLLGFTSVITDITEKLQLEQNLRQSQKMEAIGTLAGGIAHDFNNILAAILGYSEIIRDQLPPGSEIRDFQDQIIKASFRARDLVQHLLLFSRKQEQQKKPVPIRDVVAEAITILRATLPSTISLDVQLNEDVGKIEADATQIHQVIVNLGTNASHAMEYTGGTLSIFLTRCSYNITDNDRPPDLGPGPYAKIEIRDTGHGIEDEHIDRIFEPFFTTKETGKGTGMGLAVVHGIVTSHSGVLQVASSPGKGSVFTVFFPIMAVEDDSPMPVAPLVASDNNEHILIVDDEESIAEITSTMLENLGYATTAVCDSHKALELFQKTPGRFDLIITDQTMPGLTGLELAKHITSTRPNIPILLCSGYSSLVKSQELHSAGITDYMMKPISRQELAEKITVLLKST